MNESFKKEINQILNEAYELGFKNGQDKLQAENARYREALRLISQPSTVIKYTDKTPYELAQVAREALKGE